MALEQWCFKGAVLRYRMAQFSIASKSLWFWITKDLSLWISILAQATDWRPPNLKITKQS